MYKYYPPHPIVVKLTDKLGFSLRQKAAAILKKYITKGAERGTKEEQSFGLLAEIVVRHKLGLPDPAKNHPLGFDIKLSSGVKIDVKCRGGKLPFKETYESTDEVLRESKHNFFARQLYDKNLDADIFLMTHLERPLNPDLPGTTRQKKWILYICGWISKIKAKKEGTYLPRGSLTEQGNTWFPYRGQEIEIYNKNLNGLNKIEDILNITPQDVHDDEKRKGDLNLTSADAIRIVQDLVGTGILNKERLEFIKNKLKVQKPIKPILHSNQYYKVIIWLKDQKQLSNKELRLFRKKYKKIDFTGI